MCRLSLCRSNAAYLCGLLIVVCVALGAFSQQAKSAPALTSGLEFGSGPGQVLLDDGFSLAGRSFTVEAWIWLNSGGGDRAVLAQVGSENLLHMLVRNDRLHLGFWADDLTGNTPVPTGEWVHIAYRYNDSTREQSVFLNGQPDGSRIADARFAENNLPLHIGAYFNFSLNPFDGRILELRVWDHVRSAAEIDGGRFGTPLVDAPGLDALFTFEGSVGANVPEATGQLIGNEINGTVVVVEPVLPPALLPAEAAIAATVPAGNLASVVQGYTSSPPPAATYPDAGVAQLSDGVVPYRVWGSPWFDFSGAWTQPIVAWENASPELTFTFNERVRIDGITLHAANSGGAEGVALPETVQVTSPGGYAASFPVVAGDDIGGMQAIKLDSLGIFTEALTITLDGASDWLALGQVTFDGAVLAEPEIESDWLSLPARRFLGLDLETEDRSALRLEVVPEPTGTRFGFPRAADDFGVQAVVEWSPDLIEWTPLPYASSLEAGRAVAYLTPPPAEGRAFFRLVFPDGPPWVVGPGSFDAAESDSPLEFALSNRLGVDSPLDPASLVLMAINDQALSALGEPTLTANGGTLQFLSDGTVRYTTAPGLAGGQVAEETFTYTVADRFGRTVRNQFILSVTGENDAPTAGNISATHSAGAVPAGIRYQYFEGDFSSEAAFDTATPVSSGHMPSFSLDPATASSGYGLEMTGELFVPATGPYTFYLSGNNASVLDVGGERVVAYDPADPTEERAGTIELSAGTHPIRVRYFDVVEPTAELSVDYSGPGFIREPIPAEAFPRLESLVLDPLASASDPDDGDVLRVSQIDGQPLDADTPVRLASGAEVQLNGDGTITYLPAPGRTLLHEATDTDSFSFTVSDVGGLTATATAQLQLARLNSAPVVEGPVSLNVTDQQYAQIVASEIAEDVDGDELRITHVNGTPLVGGNVLTLPSSAQVSLSTERLTSPDSTSSLGPVPFGLRYDADNLFLFTLSRPGASDAYTITLTDAAGAKVVVDVAGSWIFGVNSFIDYADSRFPLGAGLAPRTARLYNHYRFPIDIVTYITDRETGLHYGQNTRTVQAGETFLLNFDLPEGIHLGEQHFFDRFDVEIDTLEGDPIYYIYITSQVQIERLYSTVSESFFLASAASNPRWGFDVVTVRGRENYRSGIHRIATDYGSFAQLFYRGHQLVRGVTANKADLEPNFAANITIEGVCRTPGSSAISRFTIQNLNDEPVPFTVRSVESGSVRQVFTVGAGQTQTIEIPYEPKIEFRVLEASLGLFDSREVSCPVDFDFTVTSLCTTTVTSFTQVQNNDPTNTYTVRIDSVDFPSIRSNPVTIGNQAEELIQMQTQGNNLGGTEGRLIIITPNSEIIGPSFIFSDDPC